MDWVEILKHYQEDIKDEDLLEEAIAVCENYFKHMDMDELTKRSKPLAMAYLALKIK